MSYGGRQGREPTEHSPEPSIFSQLITGLATMFVAMIVAHCAGVIS